MVRSRKNKIERDTKNKAPTMSNKENQKCNLYFRNN